MPGVLIAISPWPGVLGQQPALGHAWGVNEIVRTTGDAYVLGYSVALGRLVIDVRYWNDEMGQIVATDLRCLTDGGTYECDAIVRVPELDSDDGRGYGVVSADGMVTLRFSAGLLEFVGPPRETPGEPTV